MTKDRFKSIWEQWIGIWPPGSRRFEAYFAALHYRFTDAQAGAMNGIAQDTFEKFPAVSQLKALRVSTPEDALADDALWDNVSRVLNHWQNRGCVEVRSLSACAYGKQRKQQIGYTLGLLNKKTGEVFTVRVTRGDGSGLHPHEIDAIMDVDNYPKVVTDLAQKMSTKEASC